ncbi:MAG: hypothetical protein BZY75_00925 [SAR202 cluster bacterium Io17-Chloro-G7]|nr:MAG: hypothetical protein BZY75_00925 [SAR202 cluster bacterium Io17-Chloro-G7]
MATKTGVVQVSGRGSNVDFTIDDSAPFSQVAKGLRDYLVENRGLWSKGTIGVNAGRWILSQDQLGQIKQIIETESGLTVGRFWCPPNRLEAAIADPLVGAETPPKDETDASKSSDDPAVPGIDSAPGPVLVQNATQAKAASAVPSTVPSIEAFLEKHSQDSATEFSRAKSSKPGSSGKGLTTEALFVKTTFRSGESIRYHGDVIVLADVNPGAEIIAEGDIVVFGSLRGSAHAGSAGDTRATIIALELDSPRIQIGPYTGLAPTETSNLITSSKTNSKTNSKTMRAGPKIAYTKRRSIYVSPYAGRFARYSRGILYEG